jgi:hypothetical protein
MSVVVLISALSAKIGHGLSQPADRVDDGGTDVIAPLADTSGDQREHALRIRLSEHQIRYAEVLQPRVDDVQTGHHAVVREDPIVLQERMGVAYFESRARRIADVRDERDSPQLVRFGVELGVLPGGNRFLVQHGGSVGLEDTDSGAIRVPLALLGEVVGRLQQPKRSRHHPPVGVKSEQPAHQSTHHRGGGAKQCHDPQTHTASYRN